MTGRQVVNATANQRSCTLEFSIDLMELKIYSVNLW